MVRKFLVVATVIAALFAGPLSAEELTEEKTKDIFKLMNVTGALYQRDQLISAYIKLQTMAVRKALPKITDDDIKQLNKLTVKTFIERSGEYLSMVVPIYAETFTHDEIKEMIAFYETPLGKKFVSVMPKFMNSTLQAGQKWAQHTDKVFKPILNAEIQAIQDRIKAQ